MIVFIIVAIIEITAFPCCSSPEKSIFKFFAIASTKLRKAARKIQEKLKKCRKAGTVCHLKKKRKLLKFLYTLIFQTFSRLQGKSEHLSLLNRAKVTKQTKLY